MTMGYWPQQVAIELNKVLGFKHPILKMNQTEIGKYLQREVKKVPLKEFIGSIS